MFLKSCLGYDWGMIRTCSGQVYSTIVLWLWCGLGMFRAYSLGHGWGMVGSCAGCA